MKLNNVKMLVDGKLETRAIEIKGNKIHAVKENIAAGQDMKGLFVAPGFVEVHAHLREPGPTQKETIKSGTTAAARGGYTHVFSMPNISPVPSNLETLTPQLDIIKRDAVVKVTPYGSITPGLQGKELSNFEEMKPYVCAYTDDGVGVQDSSIMKEAMIKAKELDMMIVAHCEENEFIESDNARAEWEQVKRDVALSLETGCRYHVCHISTKESVEYVRQAKAKGAPVSCEVSPHHLLLTINDHKNRPNFKMNPPLREEEDVVACIQGVVDGTIDIIATDHAPHTEAEKAAGWDKAPYGITGFETSFDLLYTSLVKTNIIDLQQLVDMMTVIPAELFKLDNNEIAEGNIADLVFIDLDKPQTIDKNKSLSKARNTPFDGVKVDSTIMMTISEGKVVYKEASYE